MSTVELMLGDCLERMKEIPDGSVDMILCDLPYGTTHCKWDTIIPFDPLWEQYWRVCKPNAAVVLFAAQPFTSFLILSELRKYRYNWIWNKRKGANFLFANKQPLKKTEDICVFYRAQPVYNPQKIKNPNGPERRASRKTRGRTALEHIAPPAIIQPGASWEPDKLLPDTILNFEPCTHGSEFIEVSKDARPVHPTQKPVALLEYLIRTYTNDGELVLDNTMGSGSTGVAALNTGRRFIGIEKDETYFNVAVARIRQAKEETAA